MRKSALLALSCALALTGPVSAGQQAPARVIPGAPQTVPGNVPDTVPAAGRVQAQGQRESPPPSPASVFPGAREHGKVGPAAAFPAPRPMPVPGALPEKKASSERDVSAPGLGAKKATKDHPPKDQRKRPGGLRSKGRPKAGKGRRAKALATGVRAPVKPPLEELRDRAVQGDPAAQVELGVRYHTGRGVAKDLAQARRWYERAAAQGNAVGQFNVGVLYAFGEGVSRDPAKAAKWYRRAAETGYPPAQFNLGVLYGSGEGVTKDGREAARWYRRAAEKGFRPAQVNLAMLYQLGEGVQKDEEEAKAWYAKASAGGDARAQYALGLLARQEGDHAAAADWYRKAAAQQVAPARAGLASLDAEGPGVPKDLPKAPGLATGAAPVAVARDSFQEPDVVGTGFVIGPDGVLLTSHRLIEEAQGKALRVFLSDGRVVAPEIVKTSKASDLAVLRVGVATPAYLEVVRAGEGPKAGDKVLAVAYLASQLKSGAPKLAGASVLLSHRSKARGSVFAVDVPREKGTAGAPVLDGQGRVVGMLPAPDVAVGPDDAAPASRGRKDWVVGAGEIRALLPGIPEPPDRPDASRLQVAQRARQALCLIVTVPKGDDGGKGEGGRGSKREQPDG